VTSASNSPVTPQLLRLMNTTLEVMLALHYVATDNRENPVASNFIPSLPIDGT